MKGFFSLVLLILFITQLHNKVAAALDSKLNNNNTQVQRCIGFHCLVTGDDETDLFMDQRGPSRMLATNDNQVTPQTENSGQQSPNCQPNGLQGSSSCLASPQLNQGRPCEPLNRVSYPYCK